MITKVTEVQDRKNTFDMEKVSTISVLVFFLPSRPALDHALVCDHYTGCNYPSSNNIGAHVTERVLEENRVLHKIFVQPRVTTDLLFDASHSNPASPLILFNAALAATILSVIDQQEGVAHQPLDGGITALASLPSTTNASILRQALALSTFQAKLLLLPKLPRSRLVEKLGEFLFLSGRLVLAKGAFQAALRFEGIQEENLNVNTKPSTLIKKVLIRAIELDLLGDGFCSNTNKNSSSSTTCISVNDNDCENHGNSENDESTSAFGEETRINSEDDITSQLTKVFWEDSTRAAAHERLEWWLAQARKLNFPHLEENLYRAGVEAGVYLSRYQRPISAQYGLRARPVWKVEDTGVAKALEKIRANWKEIRAEGRDLMAMPRMWKEDPGFNSIPGARGWWGEVAVKGVALHSASEQAAMCRNAMLTCRLLQQFPQSSGCPKCKASFSLISANTTIPPHAGPTNSRLRAHLGLVVPKKGEVSIRVGNETVGWKPGKWTIIDDSFEHEVVNNGDGPRLILLVDFRHPDVTEEAHKEEFNWSKEDMTAAGLARSGSVRGGFPDLP